MGVKKNDSERNFIKDDSMLTEAQKKRIKKVNNRIETNSLELEKWKDVLQAEQAQDMKKVALHTAEVVEAITARGEYLLQKRGTIIEQINEEHKGGSSLAAKSLAGEPDEYEEEYLDVIADEQSQQGKHLNQTDSFVKYKDKKKKLIKADGTKIDLGAGEKIVLDDNTFEEVVDFITDMNEKFPELGLKPENISFEVKDSMDTLDRLKEHFGDNNAGVETKMEDEQKEEDSKTDMGEEEAEKNGDGIAVRFVGIILDDEQQLLVSGIDRDNFDEMLKSDRFRELFPDDKYEIILNDEDGADLVIKAKRQQSENSDEEDSDDESMSLEDALKV